MKGVCRLCKKEKELKKSHIIPKFCYDEMRNEKGRKEILEIPENDKEKKSQDGWKEYLLCADCEQQLSAYESYLGRAFKDYLWKDAKPFCFSNGQQADFGKYRKANIRYEKFFMGIISIFWRLSVSKTTKYDIRLGPYKDKLEEILNRNLILYQDQIKLLIFKLKLRNDELNDLILYRGKSRFSNSHLAQNIWLMGYSIYMVLGNGRIEAEELCLKESGDLYVCECEVEKLKDFKRLCNMFTS